MIGGVVRFGEEEKACFGMLLMVLGVLCPGCAEKNN
jgi:hypothetical protein